MQKRVTPLFMCLSLMLIGFVSAAAFSLSDMLSGISEGTLIVLLVFVVSFALLFFALSRLLFKDNKPIAAVVSFALAFGITYWINKSGINLGGWFLDIGISSEVLSILIPIVAIAVSIFLIIALKGKSLLVFGGLALASSLFVYEKAIVIVVGVILLFIGFLLMRKKKKPGKDYPEYLKHLFPQKRR